MNRIRDFRERAQMITISPILIANRGEIAVFIIKASKALGVETYLADSEADREHGGNNN